MSNYGKKEEQGAPVTKEQIEMIKSIMLVSNNNLDDLIFNTFASGNKDQLMEEVEEPGDLYRHEAQQIIDEYYKGMKEKPRAPYVEASYKPPERGLSHSMLSTKYNKKIKKSIGMGQIDRLTKILVKLKMTITDLLQAIYGPESPDERTVHTVYELNQLEAYALLVHPICEAAEREINFEKSIGIGNKEKSKESDDFIDIFS